MSTPADKKIKTWQRAGAVVLALSVWQAASWAVGSALLLPGPVTVLGRLCALAVTSAFRRAVAFSFCRIAGGFALALVLAFVLGLCMSTLRGKTIGDTLYNGMKDFSGIIDQVLHSVIIPLLPLYVCGTFIDMTKSGKTYAILGILWKVFLVVIIMHLVCIFLQFCVAGAVSHKSPFKMIRNQIPGYTTALGTQSSAATIPVNLQCAAADGVSEQIRNFVVPLCANIHMAGSMITITACATAVCLMNQLPISLATVVPFIMTLGVAMVASPGAPGGSIMTALPFLYMIFGAEAGDPNGPICAIMVALYITQDSFGTACNVSGDNAIGVIVETIYQKFINKSSASV